MSLKTTASSFLFLAVIVLVPCLTFALDSQSIAFTVGESTTSTVALIVPKSATKQQLYSLIMDLRKAKQENNFARLIPPTTPRGNRGPYFVVTVFVLDDPKLATSDSLDKFIQGDEKAPFAKRFANGIRAYYYYTGLSNEEQGSLGYSDSQVKTKSYEKLF